jgi:hypothetical protein
MSLLRGQADVSAQVAMPTDRVDDASTVTAVSGETVTWSYVNSGAWASATGQAASTICTAKLAFTGILNSMKSALGSYNDTSLSFAAATRAASKVTVPEEIFSQMVFLSPTDQKATITPYLATAGDYAIDHRRGQIWLKSKDTVANDSASYSYMAPVAGGSGPTANVNIDQLQGVEIPLDDAAFTPGTSSVLPVGYFADETTPDSVTEGDIGAARMTLDRKQITASEAIDDAAFTASSYISQSGFLADEATTDSVDEGDVGVARMTLNRRQIMAGQTLDDAAFGVGTEYANATGFLADEAATDSVDEGDIGIARMTLDRKQLTANQVLDDAGFTPGTSYIGVVGAQADETASDSVDEGDAGALRMTLDRRLITAGQILDDAAFGVGTSYVSPIAALADETATDSVDEGDTGAVRMTLDRKLYTLSLPDPAPLFDSDADNTAQAIKASAGRLFSLDVINPNPTPCYVQLFNAATASVTVGTTVPNYVIYVPASGSVTKEWPGLFFATAITYAATTTATGSGDPTTGLTFSASYL